MMTEEESKAMAAQLGKPDGEAGIGMANIMNETNIGMTKSAIDSLDVQPGQVILEAGHGNCGHLSYLLGKAADLHYHGLEISDTMYKEAGKLNAEAVRKGVAEFHLYDGSTIPLDDNSIDACFTVNTIYFWKDRVALLNEFARVLKPGGRIAICFAQKNFMEQLPFTKFGFHLVSTNDVLYLIEQSALEPGSVHDHVETVKTKTGDEVERQYTVVLGFKH